MAKCRLYWVSNNNSNTFGIIHKHRPIVESNLLLLVPLPLFLCHLHLHLHSVNIAVHASTVGVGELTRRDKTSDPDHPCICTRAGSNPHTCQSRFEIERTRSRGVLRVSTAGKLRGGESEVVRVLVVGAEFAFAIAIARLCGRRKYVREDIAKV
jgi:hypothetical protein